MFPRRPVIHKTRSVYGSKREHPGYLRWVESRRKSRLNERPVLGSTGIPLAAATGAKRNSGTWPLADRLLLGAKSKERPSPSFWHSPAPLQEASGRSRWLARERA